MKNKLPCELIQDLFPSYIEGLTSEVTNNIVEEHTAECSDCKLVLKAMKEPAVESAEYTDKKEIDFLKKNRKKNCWIVAGSILAAFVIVVVVLIAKLFFIGNYIYSDSVACEVQVEGKSLMLKGVTADTSLGISKVEYTEEKGVVIVSLKAVKKSPFHESEFQSEYTADNEIMQVCLDDRIIWDHGKKVSAIASAVFNTRHEYVGNMSENLRTAKALNMTNYLGGFTNELQTDTEPYGWKIVMEDEINPTYRQEKEKDMKSYAYILLAVIDNLGEVSFAYTVDKEVCTVSVTAADATAFAGQDIKTCGQDVLALQTLMEKTGLDSYAYISDDSLQHTQETIQIEIMNNTTEEISQVMLACYRDGTLYSSQGSENADGSLISKGETMCFEFVPADFGGEKWNEESDLMMEVSVYDKNGNCHEIEAPFHISAEFGVIYNYILTGNTVDGFEIQQ